MERKPVDGQVQGGGGSGGGAGGPSPKAAGAGGAPPGGGGGVGWEGARVHYQPAHYLGITGALHIITHNYTM